MSVTFVSQDTYPGKFVGGEGSLGKNVYGWVGGGGKPSVIQSWVIWGEGTAVDKTLLAQKGMGQDSLEL